MINKWPPRKEIYGQRIDVEHENCAFNSALTAATPYKEELELKLMEYGKIEESYVKLQARVKDLTFALQGIMPYLAEDEFTNCLTPAYAEAIKRAKQAIEGREI